MCGIGGVFYRDPNHPVDPAVLIGMAAIQYHRGPDGFGYEVVPDRGSGSPTPVCPLLIWIPSGAVNPFGPLMAST
jgi:hypothetical protein